MNQIKDSTQVCVSTKSTVTFWNSALGTDHWTFTFYGINGCLKAIKWKFGLESNTVLWLAKSSNAPYFLKQVAQKPVRKLLPPSLKDNVRNLRQVRNLNYFKNNTWGSIFIKLSISCEHHLQSQVRLMCERIYASHWEKDPQEITQKT